MTADSRTGRPRASSRETLAEAACELFLEQGYHRTTLNDVADRLNITKPALYNYFGGKDGLYAAVLERDADQD